MTDIPKESDSLGEVNVPADKLWGAQTQRSLEHLHSFSRSASTVSKDSSFVPSSSNEIVGSWTMLTL